MMMMMMVVMVVMMIGVTHVYDDVVWRVRGLVVMMRKHVCVCVYVCVCVWK